MPICAAVFIDAIYVKVRDGQVGNQPFYAVIGVDLGGHRDVLSLWAGHGGGESAKFWMMVLADLTNLRAIYRAPSVEAARAAFEELAERWGKPYPAIPKLWRAAWEEFTPFLAYGACCGMGCRGGVRRRRFGRMVRGQLLPSGAA